MTNRKIDLLDSLIDQLEILGNETFLKFQKDHKSWDYIDRELNLKKLEILKKMQEIFNK